MTSCSVNSWVVVPAVLVVVGIATKFFYVNLIEPAVLREPLGSFSRFFCVILALTLLPVSELQSIDRTNTDLFIIQEVLRRALGTSVSIRFGAAGSENERQEE